MIAIILTVFLFLFVSTTIGYLINKRCFQKSLTSLFDDFLVGISAQLVYFNIWSFFFPTDYIALVIPLLIAATVTIKSGYLTSVKESCSLIKDVLFSKQHILVTAAVAIVLITFACVVPYNEDSAGYHYLSILWSEEFKIIPGLANLSAKYGTHSSFFVLSAAYSFSDVVGYAIYPANFVIVPTFCCWLLYKSFQMNDVRRYFLWLMLLILFRYLLINITSPSHDALSTSILFYVLFSFYIGSWRNQTGLMIVLAFTAVTLKLNTIPILLLILYVLLHQPKRSFNVIVFVGILIFIPWFARGIFISGYPLFPSTYFDFFNVDWKLPAAVAEAEKTHITMAPRLLGLDFISLKSLSVFEWVPKWYVNLWKDNLVNATVVSMALISPFFWSIAKWRSDKVRLIVYLISYIGVWFWILTSPDIRFGIVFKLFCIFIPLSLMVRKVQLSKPFQYFAVVAMMMACIYYTRIGFQKIPNKFLSSNLVLPPRDVWYYKNNDLKTFRYIMLNNKVKLYVWDSAHHSVNAPFPVFSTPDRHGIDTGVNVELRGEDVQHGFKYKKR